MNHSLFAQAIGMAQGACIGEDRGAFVVAVRVAQSTVPEKGRIVRLLETAIGEFPSDKSQRILQIVADHAAYSA